MEALILKEENPKSQGMQEELKYKGLKEEEHGPQILEDEVEKLHSIVEELKLGDFEEDPKSLSLKEEGRDGLGSNENVLQFLDSMDGYLTLMDSLSWTLRQGWLQLASARHSMGGARVSSAALDMKPHSAATYMEVCSSPDAGSGENHQFTLLKWASNSGNGSPCSDDSQQLREQKDKDEDPAQVTAEDDYEHQLQKERLKSLSVFGALVSPKLRAAQLSFETALEALLEIANMRSMMLSSFLEVRKEMESENGK